MPAHQESAAVYLDTSALIKLYVNEDGAEKVEAAIKRFEVAATSVVAYAEARAALARRRRETTSPQASTAGFPRSSTPLGRATSGLD